MRIGAGVDDARVLFLQIAAGAGQRAAGADRANETVDLAAGLLPDLRSGGFVMRLGVVEIVPLVGEQHAVRLGLAKLGGQPPPDMLIVVRIGEGQRRHFDQLGAAQPQHVLLFLALRFRDQDQRAITARAGDDRETDAGIAGGRFHHQPAGLEVAALLGLQDHPFARAVLDRLAGIHEFGLAENGAAGQLGSALEFDEGRVADRFDDVFVEGHVLKLPVCLPNRWATLKDRRRADKPAVKQGCSARFREHHLTHVDISGQEPRLAIGEVILPQPPEAVVEA